MIVGTCRLRLHLPESGSLKDKRQVLRSVEDRLRRRYRVAVAEIGEQASWQNAVIGVACVSESPAVCRRLLDDLVRWAEEAGPFEVVEAEIDVR